MNWYRIDSHNALPKLGTSELGLSPLAVRERLKTYELNRLAQEVKISRLKIVLHQFMSPLIYILFVAAFVTIFLHEPYVPAQVPWTNLVTNGLQDVALAFEPGEQKILDRPPRDPREGIMSRLLIQRTLLVSTVISAGTIYNFVSALQDGESLKKARTLAVTTIVFFQFFQAWNSRSKHESIFRINPFSNMFLFYSMIAAFLAQLALLYTSPFQWIFRTVPLTGAEWAGVIGVSATVLVAVELDKWLRRIVRQRRE